MNYKELVTIASMYDSVLEIGCGEGKFLHRVTAKKKVGVDAFEPVMKKGGFPDVEYVVADLSNGLVGTLFTQNDFECVAGIDIIEHFTKDDAIHLIEDCEIVASKCVMFFIPVGNHPQTEDDRGLGNDFYQTHRSTWYPEDMEALGYRVWYNPNHHKQEGKDTGAMFCVKYL